MTSEIVSQLLGMVGGRRKKGQVTFLHFCLSYVQKKKKKKKISKIN